MAKRWGYVDFDRALHNLKAKSKDSGELDNPSICKHNRRHIPCCVRDNTPAYNEGDVTKYFKKGKSGHWGFRYDNFNLFMKLYFKQIDKLVQSYEAERIRGKEAKQGIKRLMRQHGFKTEAEATLFLLKGVNNG